jgi:hypothetical protein
MGEVFYIFIKAKLMKKKKKKEVKKMKKKKKKEKTKDQRLHGLSRVYLITH